MVCLFVNEWCDFVCVNSIFFGYIDIGFLDFIDVDIQVLWRSMIFLGCNGDVKELKGVYVYFCSDVSMYIMGVDIVIDGGYICW